MSTALLCLMPVDAQAETPSEPGSIASIQNKENIHPLAVSS